MKVFFRRMFRWLVRAKPSLPVSSRTAFGKEGQATTFLKGGGPMLVLTEDNLRGVPDPKPGRKTFEPEFQVPPSGSGDEEADDEALREEAEDDILPTSPMAGGYLVWIVFITVVLCCLGAAAFIVHSR